MSHFVNGEDPYEMLHHLTFHHGLYYLLRQNDLQRKKYIFV